MDDAFPDLCGEPLYGHFEKSLPGHLKRSLWERRHDKGPQVKSRGEEGLGFGFGFQGHVGPSTGLQEGRVQCNHRNI